MRWVIHSDSDLECGWGFGLEIHLGNCWGSRLEIRWAIGLVNCWGSRLVIHLVIG